MQDPVRVLPIAWMSTPIAHCHRPDQTPPPSQHLPHLLRDLIDPRITVLLDEVEDPAPPTRQSQIKTQRHEADPPLLQSEVLHGYGPARYRC